MMLVNNSNVQLCSSEHITSPMYGSEMITNKNATRHKRCFNQPEYIFSFSLIFVETTATTVPSTVTSNYSSALTRDDGRYKRPGSLYSTGFLYKAIQVIVNTTGTYSLASVSDLDTNGYLYNDTFDPSNPSVNLIHQDDDNGGNRQFKITAFLQAGVPYTLVLSTQSTGYSGPFTIVGSGPGNVQYVTLNPMEITTTSE